MSAGTYNISIEQDSTFSLVFIWLAGQNQPVDLAGYTAALQIRPYALSPTILYDASPNISLGGVTGIITLSIPSGTTQYFNWFTGVYDLVMTDSSGVATRLLEGAVTVVPSATQIAMTNPNPPTISNVIAGNASALIYFIQNSAGGSPITSFTATSNPSGIIGTGTSSPLTVNGLTNGTPYVFTMTATNAIGTSDPSAASSPVTPTSNTIPDTPAIGIATAANASASISFVPGSNGGLPITAYTMTSNPGAISATGLSSPITVSGLTNGTAYTFSVTATNSLGTSAPSALSNSVTPFIATVPVAPTIGVASAVNTSASVTFTANSTGGSPITGFTATSNPGGLTGVSTSSPITVLGLTNSVTYTFTVTAANAIGTSAPSAASNAVTPSTTNAPAPPTIGTATAGNTFASVTFTANGTGGSAITGFTVTSSPGNITGSGTGSPISVFGLTNGTPYTFTVTATNVLGTSNPSASSNQVTPATIPDAPTIGAVTGGNSIASVAFTAPASNGGSPITLYTALSSPGGFSGTSATSPIAVNGLANGTAYTFTVTATNAVGVGPASNASASVTPATVPSAPTIGTATAGNASASITFTPNANGGAAITSYTAISSPGGISGSGSSIPVVVNGLANGAPYTFTVTATNSAGTSSASAASNAVTPSSNLTITTSSIPSGTVGTAYSTTLAASGGTSPYTWSVSSGTLPAGLSLNATTGAITGTPTAASTASVTFQVVDSLITNVFPTLTVVADNEGNGNIQHQGGISSTSSTPLVAGIPVWAFTTAATYGGQHNGRGLTLIPTPTTVATLLQDIMGPANAQSVNALNASQETAMWNVQTPAAGTTTFEQWFGTAGYGGQNAGDQDFQAFWAAQINGATAVVGSNSAAQTGTNYAGVAAGTALNSGTITVAANQLPATLFGFSVNTTNFTLPVPAAGFTQLLTTWAFAQGLGNSVTIIDKQITTAGTYQASYTAPTGAVSCYQTFAVIYKGSTTVATATKPLSFSISSGSVVNPSAPSNLQILFQGMSIPGQGTGGSSPTPTAPNTQAIGWSQGTAGTYPITQNKIYRGTNGATPTLYATITAGTSYTDTAATNCLGSTATPHNAQGQNWPANGYLYQVSAVDSQGNEGPKSGTQIFVIYKNGSQFGTGGDYNNAMVSTYNDTTGIAGNPFGSTHVLLNVTQGSNGQWLPWVGNNATQWNIWCGPGSPANVFNYLNISIRPSKTGQTFNTWIEYRTDVNGDPGSQTGVPNIGSGTTYGPATVVNVWGTYRIPLNLLMVSDASYGNIVEGMMYKFGINDNNGGNQAHWWVDNMYLSFS